MKNAQVIYFLGFGFHDTNMERLKIQEFLSQKYVTGTCSGFTEREKGRIKEKHKGIRLVPADTLTFLRNHVAFD